MRIWFRSCRIIRFQESVCAVRKKTGDYVRKYAKKHNEPRIDKLKYTDGEVGSCIDISHEYGMRKAAGKVVLESRVPYRMDVYYKKRNRPII